jgi:hypothetical protein
MTIPAQSLNIRDPGIGVSPSAVNAFLYAGCCEKGAVNTLQAFGRKGSVIDTLGQGPLSEQLCSVLDVAGGPVYAMRLTGSIAGAAGAVTVARLSTSTGTLTVAGAPFDAYYARVEIVGSGTVGAARFRYCLDASPLLKADQYTWSEALTVPAGGSYPVPNTNLAITFVPGAGAVFFEAGDVFSFACSAPYYTTSDLAAAIAVVLADSAEFAAVVLGGEPPSGAAGATMFAAFSTHLQSLQAQFRYVRGIMDMGTDTPAAVIAAFAAQASGRIAPCYGDCAIASSKPFAGWGTPSRPITVPIAARAAASAISTDLGRFADGPLTGVVAISHDEFRTELLDAQKISTLRTWQGAPGFYVCNARLKSPVGSDFLYWQHGRVMDAACDTTVKAQMPFVNTSVRTKGDGSIDERDAARMEAKVISALTDRLLSPSTAEGTPGHVSDLDYAIDRGNNVLTTFTLQSTVAVQPRGYVKTLATDISFAIIGR